MRRQDRRGEQERKVQEGTRSRQAQLAYSSPFPSHALRRYACTDAGTCCHGQRGEPDASQSLRYVVLMGNTSAYDVSSLILRLSGGRQFLENDEETIKKLEKKLGGKEKASRKTKNLGFGDVLDTADEILQIFQKPPKRDKKAASETKERRVDGDAGKRTGRTSKQAEGRAPMIPNVKDNSAFDMMHDAETDEFDKRAFENRLDTRGMFKVGGAGADQSGGSKQEELPPEVAELVEMAKFAAKQPMYGLDPNHLNMLKVEGGQEKSMEEGRGASEGGSLTRVPSLQVEALEKQGRVRLMRAQGASPQEILKEMLHGNSTMKEISRFFRENYEDLVRTVPALNRQVKRKDLGRGRGSMHIPSKFTPMMREESSETEPEVEWQRWSKSYKKILAKEKGREDFNIPPIWKILSEPGWNLKVNDLHEIDGDGNLIEPDGPDLNLEYFDRATEEDKEKKRMDVKMDKKSSFYNAHLESSDEEVLLNDVAVPEQVSLTRDEDLFYMIQEMDKAEDNDDKEALCSMLVRIKGMELNPEQTHQLTGQMKHLAAKFRSSSSRAEKIISEKAEEMLEYWEKTLIPKYKLREYLKKILPKNATTEQKPSQGTKKFSLLRQRLREAGMPTGGSKRRILDRIKELDAKEERRRSKANAVMDEEVDKEGVANEEEVNPGVLASKNLDLDSMESLEPSRVDERFEAIYTDPDFRLDPLDEKYSYVKGRANVHQKRYVELKRFMKRDEERREKEAKRRRREGGEEETLRDEPEDVNSIFDKARRSAMSLQATGNNNRRDDAERRGRREIFGDSTDSAAAGEEEAEIGEAMIEELPGPSSDSGVRRETVDGEISEEDDSLGDDDDDDDDGSSSREGTGRGTEKMSKSKRKRLKEKERLKRKKEREWMSIHPLDRMRMMREKGLDGRMAVERELEKVRAVREELAAKEPSRSEVEKPSKMLFEQSQTMRRFEMRDPGAEELKSDRGLMQKFFIDGMRDGVMYEDRYPIKVRSRHERLPGNVSSWNSMHVERWIGRHASSFGEDSATLYKKIFSAFRVDGRHLTNVDKQDLEDMGVQSQHVKILLDQIRPLRMQMVSLQEEERKMERRRAEEKRLALRRREETSLQTDQERAGALWDRKDSETRLQQYWTEVLTNHTIQISTPKRLRDLHKIPEHDIFEEDETTRKGAFPLPAASLPMVQTDFGMLRVYTEADLKRENAHLKLNGPCPFECSCCVI